MGRPSRHGGIHRRDLHRLNPAPGRPFSGWGGERVAEARAPVQELAADAGRRPCRAAATSTAVTLLVPGLRRSAPRATRLVCADPPRPRRRKPMFTTQERDHIRDQLLARARADDAIVGAAYTGSLGTGPGDRKSTRLNSSHSQISYAGFCLKKKKRKKRRRRKIKAKEKRKRKEGRKKDK